MTAYRLCTVPNVEKRFGNYRFGLGSSTIICKNVTYGRGLAETETEYLHGK